MYIHTHTHTHTCKDFPQKTVFMVFMVGKPYGTWGHLQHHRSIWAFIWCCTSKSDIKSNGFNEVLPFFWC